MEKFESPNKHFWQALADLGFPRELWNTLSPDQAQQIITNQVRYESFVAKNRPEKNISDEFRKRFKQIYENLQEHIDYIELVQENDPEKKKIFDEVLRLGGNAKTVTEIDNFIAEHQDRISDEELDLLNMKKEWLQL